MLSFLEKPALAPLSTRVNLDEVFGYVYENVISETVTPYKLVVCDLINLTREIDPDDSTLFREEALMINSIVYGLMNRRDMPFEDVKRCVRHLDRHIRKEMRFFDRFMERMVSKQRGEAKKVHFIESQAGDTRRKTTAGMFNYKSPMQLFTQKLYVAGCNLTQQEHFEMHRKLKEYISGIWPLEIPGPRRKLELPFEINTSLKARQWLRKQMHLLQVCPTEAMKQEELLDWCRKIKNCHVDIADVHLLEAINHISQDNAYKAQESLRRFIDFSVFKPNTCAAAASTGGNSRLGVVDQRPFRYGPLLIARLHRVFGDRHMARSLLFEALREAQSANDIICHKMVCLELSLMSASHMGRAETDEERNLRRRDREGQPIVDVVTSDKSGSATERDPEEHHSTVEMQLDCAMVLAMTIDSLRRGELDRFDFATEFAESVSLDDKDAKARQLHEAGMATMSSFRIVQGHYTNARNTATALIESNGSDGIASRHETEAQVIARINMVYTDCIEGDWNRAMTELKMIERDYPREINWKCAKHVHLAKSCVLFNNYFRQGKFDECEAQLRCMEKLSHQEWLLKKCLLMAVRGKLKEAANVLENEEEALKRGGPELYYSARVNIESAIVSARLGMKYLQEQYLKDLPGLLIEKQIIPLSTLVYRRLGIYYYLRGQTKTAWEYIDEAYSSTSHSILDGGLAALAAAAIRLESKDLTHSPLTHLNQAQMLFEQGKYPLLTKMVLKFKTEWYEWTADEENLMATLEAFCQLDDAYPGEVDWLLL